jgi:hypothetical protein
MKKLMGFVNKCCVFEIESLAKLSPKERKLVEFIVENNSQKYPTFMVRKK